MIRSTFSFSNIPVLPDRFLPSQQFQILLFSQSMMTFNSLQDKGFYHQPTVLLTFFLLPAPTLHTPGASRLLSVYPPPSSPSRSIFTLFSDTIFNLKHALTIPTLPFFFSISMSAFLMFSRSSCLLPSSIPFPVSSISMQISSFCSYTLTKIQPGDALLSIPCTHAFSTNVTSVSFGTFLFLHSSSILNLITQSFSETIFLECQIRLYKFHFLVQSSQSPRPIRHTVFCMTASFSTISAVSILIFQNAVHADALKCIKQKMRD